MKVPCLPWHMLVLCPVTAMLLNISTASRKPTSLCLYLYIGYFFDFILIEVMGKVQPWIPLQAVFLEEYADQDVRGQPLITINQWLVVDWRLFSSFFCLFAFFLQFARMQTLKCHVLWLPVLPFKLEQGELSTNPPWPAACCDWLNTKQIAEEKMRIKSWKEPLKKLTRQSNCFSLYV